MVLPWFLCFGNDKACLFGGVNSELVVGRTVYLLLNPISGKQCVNEECVCKGMCDRSS
jgi:hypothetical protein